MKKCHERGLKWKSPLLDDIKEEWHLWVAQLAELKTLKFPRYVPFNETTKIVIFTDASEIGYGAAAYCHTYEKNTNTYHSNLLCAKSRISPLNRLLTLPQKELSAALIGAELGHFLKEELGLGGSRFRFFSDSQITLWWLVKPPEVLIPFVGNRVEKIQKLGFKFQYVKTKDNPADLTSRPNDVNVLQQDFWQKGPEWLRREEDQWPKQEINFENVNKTLGLRKKNLFTYSAKLAEIEDGSITTSRLHPVNKSQKVDGKEIWPSNDVLLQIGAKDRIPLLDYYSTWRDLRRNTASLFRVIKTWKTKALKSDIDQDK